MRFHFDWKSDFGVQSALYLWSHEFRRNKTQTSMDFISVILTEMKFQTDIRFSCEHNLPEAKWVSADSFDIAFNAHERLKLIAGVISLCHSDRYVVSFRVVKYHLNTTQNEMPTHVHQNIGSFWNAAEMKRHVNRTCFHAGFKSQTGMSSFRPSRQRTLFVLFTLIIIFHVFAGSFF